MNAITPTSRGAVASAPAKDPAEARRAGAISILRGEDRLTSLTRALTEAFELSSAATHSPPGLPALERARWVIDHLPSEAAVEDLVRRLDEALLEPADDRANRALVALLIDSFPQAAQERGVLVEAMLADLRDLSFGPVLVAQALRGLRREARFVPSIAEVLEACRAAQDELRQRRSLLEGIARRRRDAEAEFLRRSDFKPTSAGADAAG